MVRRRRLVLYGVVVPDPANLMDPVLRQVAVHPAELEREVTGSFVYPRFCRIDGGKVPDEKTMVRLGQLLDAAALREVFDPIVGSRSTRR